MTAILIRKDMFTTKHTKDTKKAYHKNHGFFGILHIAPKVLNTFLNPGHRIFDRNVISALNFICFGGKISPIVLEKWF